MVNHSQFSGSTSIALIHDLAGRMIAVQMFTDYFKKLQKSYLGAGTGQLVRGKLVGMVRIMTPDKPSRFKFIK